MENSQNVHKFVNIEDIFAKTPGEVTTRAQCRTKKSIDKDVHIWMQYFDDNNMEWQCPWIIILHEEYELLLLIIVNICYFDITKR